MATDSIIKPVDLDAKSPFNKKIVLVIALVALAFVAIAAMLGKAANSPSAEVEAPASVNPFTEGTSRSVANEWEELNKNDKPSKQVVPETKITNASTEPANQNSHRETTRQELNVPKDDIIAQGEISAISIVDEDEQISVQKIVQDQYQSAEQKLADLMPKRLTEEEAFIKSAQMSAAMQGAQGTSQGGFLNQSAASPMAAKTDRFMSSLGRNNAQVLRRNSAPGQWVVTAGKTIPAITRRAQNSDLPCAVEATTAVDVYDSYTSTRLLIPKGSELIGVCSNDIAYGQNRILSAFTRLILPNGEWFDLNGAAGMDRSGATGLKGDVDNHFFQMFTSAFMIAFIADRVDSKNTNNNTYIGNAESAKSAAGQVMVDTSEFMLDRNKQIQPTIDVEAGTRVFVQVKHDMVFD